MERYRTLYLWMFIPFLIAQIGIFYFYWSKFTFVYWNIHVHYWAVTVWYLLVIIQPYLIVHGKVSNHRTLGIFGFLIAGAVIASGLSILDVPLKLAQTFDPARPGPPMAFFYGTLIVEFIMLCAFTFAIANAIWYRHNIHQHAWWLICSAFFMIAPALGRGMIVFWRSVLPPETFTPLFPLISTEIIYLCIFTLFIIKFGAWRHLATYIGFSLVLVRMLRLPLGSNDAVQSFLHSVIKWM
ncbi:MAG: hypothetical protein R3241_09285 [Rheinheimera sp.]|nr:hypothetical protein [Rheinheimera sp.]